MAKARTYIIYYKWRNTSKNHAGMAYLAKSIKDEYPEKVKLIKIPSSIYLWPYYLQRSHFYFLVFYLRLILKSNDKLFLMEYLGNVSGNQTGLAVKLRKWGIKNKFVGLVHLSGKNLLELYGSKDYILLAANTIDNIIVFGSSLKQFFSDLGFGQKVITTFHYVDTDYYVPLGHNTKAENLQVIVMGSIKRNFIRLQEIIKACSEVNFHICQGYQDLSEYFIHSENVKLYSYLSEQQLLYLMQSCQVSLSILEDTVGSNVITTSMACGLVNVASDVGSIRDYCNEENAILCNDNDDFIKTLKILARNNDIIEEKSKNAIRRSMKLSLHQSIKEFLFILI